MPTLEHRIESFFPTLSKTEKRIAQYSLLNKDKIAYQTLQELSQNLKVGEASIIRFCQKLGCRGFSELKLIISKEEVQDEKNFENYVSQIQESLHQSIDNTFSLQNMEKLNQAIEWITQKERIFLYGVGSSGLTAQEAQAKFLRYGKMCYLLKDSHFQLMSSAILKENDLVIAFSLTGYTKEVIEVLEVAKKSAASILLVTNQPFSPAAKLADLVILTSGKETPLKGGSLSAKISQLYVVDILSTGYALKNRETAKQMLEKTSASIIPKSKESSL